MTSLPFVQQPKLIPRYVTHLTHFHIGTDHKPWGFALEGGGCSKVFDSKTTHDSEVVESRSLANPKPT